MANTEDNQALLPEDKPSTQETRNTGEGEVVGVNGGTGLSMGEAHDVEHVKPAIESISQYSPATRMVDARSDSDTKADRKANADSNVDLVAVGTIPSTSSNPGNTPPASVARPALVQLGGNPANNITGSPATQHKKFTAVNISKKFFEKNSNAPGSSPSASSSSVSKSSGPLLRPPINTTPSHPRLVTTKLTAGPQSSASPGPGWSRPSSASPSVASTSGANASPLPTALNGTTPLPQGSAAPSLAPVGSSTVNITSFTSAAPQLPHAGKVIQPQPRVALSHSAISATTTKTTSAGLGNTGPSKSAWGNVKAGNQPSGPALTESMVQADFPTAAEVAQGTTKKPLQVEPKSTSQQETVISSKQTRNEEADTFRGVHLDPNAHHWDEMEEDDDNFLDDVIDFGDGRQYKIESTVAPSPPRSPEAPSQPEARRDSRSSAKEEIPVSKEERFADDFDRSWPRARPSPSVSTHGLPASAAIGGQTSSALSASPVSSHQQYSPQEQARVLFNERSNRLEPYNYGAGNGQHSGVSKRADYSASPTDLRRGRDNSSHPNGFQLLQKQSNNDLPPRPRASSGSSGFNHVPPLYRERERGGDRSRREATPTSATFPMQGSRPREPFNSSGPPPGGRETRDSHGEPRGRRPFGSSMGPPPVPSHAKDGPRQPPPHLAQSPASTGVLRESQPFSRDARLPRPPSSIASSTSGRFRSRSPSASRNSGGVGAPVLATELAASRLSTPELDTVRKDVMHTAAERAKQRRLQEEEEREREKDRARRKAAEIEAKIKAAEAAKANPQQTLHQQRSSDANNRESEAVALIEEAITAAKNQQIPNAGASSTKSNFHRPHSLQTSTPPHMPPTDILSPVTPVTAASQADSWRRKAVQPSASDVQQHQAKQPFIAALPSDLPHSESTIAENEELEVVDFSDLAQFVGENRTTHSVKANSFEDHDIGSAKEAKTESGTWRRTIVLGTTESGQSPGPGEATEHRPSTHIPQSSEFSSSALPTLASNSDAAPGQTLTVPHPGSQQRAPRTQTFYKEATISALNDAMSRIKGALDGMHTLAEQSHELEAPPQISASSSLSSHPASLPDVSKSTPKDRWVPPPLRPRHFDVDLIESFATGCEPPRSPKPAWNTHPVRLPRVSIAREPINKKQLLLANRPPLPARWDMLLSFDPPLIGMHRRDFSLNEVLFGKPMFKGKSRYRVYLPRPRGFTSGPRVSLPAATAHKPNGVGAFGRPSGVDNLSSWRKAGPISPVSASLSKELDSTELDTMSRSPPPELLRESSPDHDNTAESSKSDSQVTRQRSQRKMPVGSSVAFYRDTRVELGEATPATAVKFIVTSELEDPRSDGTPVKVQSAVLSPPNGFASTLDESNGKVNAVTSPRNPEFAIQPLPSKGSDSSTDRGLLTPPHTHSSTLPWSKSPMAFPIKESPARAPDKEHLKALWSQPSDKSSVTTVNSLKGIADDLTALPFTLQDVKSEDGETPPPTTAPSRMSQHDITRSFQQVPSSSSSSSSASHQRTALSPSMTAAQPAKPHSFAYPMPSSSQSWPAPYASYPTPVMSHAPGQPLMFTHPMAPSPVPARMTPNGHAPVYGQPVWVQQVPVPVGQNGGNAMRSVQSPYSPHLVAYPPPGTAPMFSPSQAVMQSPGHQNAGAANRGRNILMMSPVMPHATAHPMYPGSPILMHSSAMPVSQNHPYMPSRGQVRNDTAHPPVQAHHPQPPHPSYAQVPPSSFSRNAW